MIYLHIFTKVVSEIQRDMGEMDHQHQTTTKYDKAYFFGYIIYFIQGYWSEGTSVRPQAGLESAKRLWLFGFIHITIQRQIHASHIHWWLDNMGYKATNPPVYKPTEEKNFCKFLISKFHHMTLPFLSSIHLDIVFTNYRLRFWGPTCKERLDKPVLNLSYW